MQPSEQKPVQTTKTNKITIDLRLIIAVLLLVIAGMLLVWRPWNATTGDRTISVTGDASVSAEPDEFVFYPSYQFENADKDAALKQLSSKSEEVVSGLKKIGLPDSQIKTNSGGYGRPVYPEIQSDASTYTLSLTITVNNKELAQKVQDYLLTTSPEGSVSPQAAFSDKKRRELENKARDEATKDARKKAEQSAENLGFSIGKVKTVNDGSGFGVMPLPAGRGDMSVSSEESKTLTVQPGQNDLAYSVTVVYYLD